MVTALTGLFCTLLVKNTDSFFGIVDAVTSELRDQSLSFFKAVMRRLAAQAFIEFSEGNLNFEVAYNIKGEIISANYPTADDSHGLDAIILIGKQV